MESVWITLQHAFNVGYNLKKIYEVWPYKEKKKVQFADYINEVPQGKSGSCWLA